MYLRRWIAKFTMAHPHCDFQKSHVQLLPRRPDRAEFQHHDGDRNPGGAAGPRADPAGTLQLPLQPDADEGRLHQVTVDNGAPTSVTTSAGALVEGLQAIGAKRVSIIAPHMKPLTRLVIEYIENEGIEVIDSISLEIPDNLKVGSQDPKAPAELWKKLNVQGADAIVASACVQMPSLASVPLIEAASGLPVVSSAVCTTYSILKNLGLERRAPQAGALLSGRY